MGNGIAYLAGGKLHVKAGPEPARVVESAFAETVRERAREIHHRQSWKTEGRGARFMSGGLLWGMPARDPAQMRIATAGLCRGFGASELLYLLETDGLTGLCAWRAEDGVERRLLHGSERRLQHLCASPAHELIACSVPHPDGTASIGVMKADASELSEVTEGDVQDQAPSWAPGPGRRLVYQSAGIGRSREGHPVSVGPSEIHALDLERGEVRTLASEPDFDLLGPRLDGDGSLFYIRRPHPRPPGFSPLRAAWDTLLLPFRLLFAFFQYLNFFHTRYTGKPLTTAGGPQREGADMRQMMVWGNLIDAEQAARENAQGDEPPSVVPRSWKLMRQAPGGGKAVLAENVLSYDLAGDGSIVYATGGAVYRLDPGGSRERLLTDQMIEQVVAIG